MIGLASFLIGWKGKAAVIAAGVVALVGLRAWDVSAQRAKGAARAVAKIEKANDNAVEIGKRGVARSRDQRVRKSLPRDPSTRDE